MNKNLILGGMDQRLIEAEKDNNFYCNNCKNEFDHIITFFPVPGLSEYYTCGFCNSILPVKDIKTKNQGFENLWSFCCFCCCF
jgi:uncharacterized Zn-finger protein